MKKKKMLFLFWFFYSFKLYFDGVPVEKCRGYFSRVSHRDRCVYLLVMVVFFTNMTCGLECYHGNVRWRRMYYVTTHCLVTDHLTAIVWRHDESTLSIIRRIVELKFYKHRRVYQLPMTTHWHENHSRYSL